MNEFSLGAGALALALGMLGAAFPAVSVWGRVPFHRPAASAVADRLRAVGGGVDLGARRAPQAVGLDGEGELRNR